MLMLHEVDFIDHIMYLLLPLFQQHVHLIVILIRPLNLFTQVGELLLETTILLEKGLVLVHNQRDGMVEDGAVGFSLDDTIGRGRFRAIGHLVKCIELMLKLADVIIQVLYLHCLCVYLLALID